MRSKRLDQLDESKLALAIWLLAKDLLSEETDEQTKQRIEAALPPLDDESEAV